MHFYSSSWIVLNTIEQEIKKKIEKLGKQLKSWDIQINYGIKTGFNEAFIIDTKKRNELIDKCPKADSIIRPILRGRDIGKYGYNWKGNWLIFIPWHFPLHENINITGSSIEAELRFKEDYTSVYEHLSEYKDNLSARNQSETGIRYEWYALQRCANTYFNYFNNEKIVYSEIVKNPQFSLDTDKMIVNDTCFIMTGERLKYILALLNSSPVAFFYKAFYAGGGLGEDGIRYKKAFLENLPIPNIIEIDIIEKIVDQIIILKGNDKSTLHLEKEIDEIVTDLFELNNDEVNYINQF